MESSATIKNNKKRDPSQHTIDKKHSQMLEYFDKNETEIIPQLKTQIKNLQKIETRMKKSKRDAPGIEASEQYVADSNLDIQDKLEAFN